MEVLSGLAECALYRRKAEGDLTEAGIRVMHFEDKGATRPQAEGL